MFVTLTTDQREVCERQIRDAATTVLSQIETREKHPSFGYTKTGIRAAFARMDGAIGLYMVLTAQANHISVGALADYMEPETEQIVARVRAAMREF